VKKTIEVEGWEIALSNQDKVIFPRDGITKAHLVDYFRKIAPYMLPHTRNRPLTLIRYVDGIAKKGFYQKSVSDYFPEWLERVTVDKEDGTVTHPLANDAATLVYLANQAAVVLHVWVSRVPKVETPDLVVFDLDPADEDFKVVRKAALQTRAVLEEIGLVPYVQTTGSRGLHVAVPIVADLHYDRVREFAHDAAVVIAARDPKRFTTDVRKVKRAGRLFIDTGRNAYAQSFAAPYTLRAKDGAPVATPIAWDELPRATPQKWNMGNVFRRLARSGDPWAAMGNDARDLRAAWEGLRAL
jgi:bifunctional non-homologous end joining protein LigD